MADEPKQGGPPKPGEPGPAAAGAGPPKAPEPEPGPVREASTRPLEATAGVPEHGERERPEAVAGGTRRPFGSPRLGEHSSPSEAQEAVADAKPAAPVPAEVKIIEAPEAKPVTAMKPAILPSEVKPILPDEKGVVVFDDAARVEWGEERAPGEAPKKGAPPAEAAPVPPAPEEGAVGWGEAPPVEERPGLPVYPPLPRQFLGTGRDIRRFIRNGTFMFFAGAVVYLLVALYCLGEAFLRVFDEWAYAQAGDFGVAGTLALLLSGGAFVGMLLSRSKLEEPLRRNDVAAVRRRLPVAVGAGIVVGLVLGGLLLHLARVKVDELPFHRSDGRAREPGSRGAGSEPRETGSRGAGEPESQHPS
jgi:hypothetical protein